MLDSHFEADKGADSGPVLGVVSMRHVPPRAVRRSIEYIHAILAGAIRLKDIADAAGMGMFRLSRTSRAATGATLHRNLTRARVERMKGPLPTQRDFPTRVT
jgi:transcriptional regulator GlxA family with amidase domain